MSTFGREWKEKNSHRGWKQSRNRNFTCENIEKDEQDLRCRNVWSKNLELFLGSFFFIFVNRQHERAWECHLCALVSIVPLLSPSYVSCFVDLRSSCCYYVFKTEDSIIINIKRSNFRCKHERSSALFDISIFHPYPSSSPSKHPFIPHSFFLSSHDNHKSFTRSFRWSLHVKMRSQFKPKQVFRFSPHYDYYHQHHHLLLRTACIFPFWFPPYYCVLVTEWIFKLN